MKKHLNQDIKDSNASGVALGSSAGLSINRDGDAGKFPRKDATIGGARVKVRVALIGNMNNNFFAFTRFLRDRGVEAELLLFDGEFDHFSPSADSYNYDYQQYVKQLEWGSTSYSLYKTPKEKIINDLAKYDIYIGCGLAPAFCYKAGLSLDIFVPYGGDIWTETQWGKNIFSKLGILKNYSAYYQRKGIKLSKIIHMSPTNDLYENQIKRFAPKVERWECGLPMVYSPQYGPEFIERNRLKTHWHEEFFKLRNSNDFLAISHMRHVWGEVSNPSAKGNDILIRGWKRFCDRNQQLSTKLLLLEFGSDFMKSKKLVLDLGLDDKVVFLPKMLRKDLFVGLIEADVVFGQFVNSWCANGVLYEGLVADKPIIAYRDDSLYEGMDLYPILNARCDHSICSRLEQIASRNFSLTGLSGKHWYEDQVVKPSMDKYCSYFKEKSA